jgi:hypothetical protein
MKRGDTVNTRDGHGVIVGRSKRRNTNGGPGTLEFVVRLDDGRIRRYSPSEVQS